MPVLFVQAPAVNLSSLSGGDNSMDSLNFASLPSVSNTVVVAVVGSSTTAATMTVSDTYGNTYSTQINSFLISSTAYFVAISYTKVSNLPASNFHVTAKFNGANTGYIGVYIAEFSGVGSTTSGLISGASGTSTHPAPTNLTVPSSCLSVAVFESDDSSFSETITAPSGWTEIDKIGGVPGLISSFIYKIAPASPSNPTWTIGTSCDWYALQRAFNPGDDFSALMMCHL